MPFNIDPAYAQYDVMSSKMVQDIWRDKYRWADEKTLSDTFHRVVHAIYENDKPTVHAGDAFDAMLKGLWIPGGRILAGAGTEKRVTLISITPCSPSNKVVVLELTFHLLGLKVLSFDGRTAKLVVQYRSCTHGTQLLVLFVLLVIVEVL
jgi:hypothetical protein